MRKYVFFLIIVLFFNLLFNCGIVFGADQAPNFKVYDLNQKIIDSASYIGQKPLILFFWTTWCPYCRKEMTLLKEKYQEFTNDGVELFAVNVEESQYRVERFVKDFSWPADVLLDKDAELAYSYNVLGFPSYIFIDRNGRIVSRGNNFTKQDYDRLLGK